MDNETHNMNYYDNYVRSMDILQLGQFDSKQDDDARVTYAVRLFEFILKQLVHMIIVTVLITQL